METLKQNIKYHNNPYINANFEKWNYNSIGDDIFNDLVELQNNIESLTTEIYSNRNSDKILNYCRSRSIQFNNHRIQCHIIGKTGHGRQKVLEYNDYKRKMLNKIFIYRENKLEEETTYKYDSYGNLLEYKLISNDSVKVHKNQSEHIINKQSKIYVYGPESNKKKYENGLLTEHIYQNSNSETEITYSYDNNSKLSKRTSKITSKSETNKIIESYDRNGNILKRKNILCRNKENIIREINYIFEYDSNGYLESVNRVNEEGSEYKTKFEYNKDCLLIEINAINAYNKEVKLQKLEYDNIGNLIYSKQFETGWYTKFNYKYDDNNNWIERESITHQLFIDKLKRKIKYAV